MRFIPATGAAVAPGRNPAPEFTPPPVPDMNRQMQVFIATMASNQETIHRGLQQVIDLCRRQESKYAVLDRELNRLQSQFTSYLSRY